MELWLIWIVCGITFFIIELFTPMLFFMNLALACLFAAIGAYYDILFAWQVFIFVGMSSLLLIFLRPILMKNITTKDTETGIEGKYLGQNAKTVLPTNNTNGRIAIYGEEWIARSLDGEEIPANSNVKIIKNDGTIFYVEKI